MANGLVVERIGRSMPRWAYSSRFFEDLPGALIASHLDRLAQEVGQVSASRLHAAVVISGDHMADRELGRLVKTRHSRCSSRCRSPRHGHAVDRFEELGVVSGRCTRR